ncbi:hypothetical protein [Peribacillus sp. SCS-155]|uniref:hypothetical protein n=1 Tax=Peribacillus sedimenti TaxID=3115297 RepID=UPI0039061BF1
MKNKKPTREFCCTESVPAYAADEFCIPEDCCPDKLETLKYPSATSCLPPDETEELEARINAANELLLDLGLSEERRNELRREEARRESFNGLIGQNVSVGLDFGETQNRNVQGRVHLSGRNFSILRRKGKQILIPHLQVCSINLQNRFAVPEEKPHLTDIEPCLRRAIALNFGQVVSQSPHLIHIFFGLTLRIYLQAFLIDKKISIFTAEQEIAARLQKVMEDSLLVEINESLQNIPLTDIVFITTKDQ